MSPKSWEAHVIRTHGRSMGRGAENRWRICLPANAGCRRAHDRTLNMGGGKGAIVISDNAA